MKKQNKFLNLSGGILAGSTLLYPLLKGSSTKKLNRLEMKFKDAPVNIENVRGKQYCEIFTAYRKFLKYKIGIYNNLKRPQMTLSEWDNLDTEKIKKELGAVKVIKNGPRFWVMDEIGGYYSGETREFNGFEFDLVAIITKSLNGKFSRENYAEHKIERYTDWHYYKDRKVFELISDKGMVYTMQSASLEINKEQTIDDLDSLADSLNPPDGWSYRVRILNEDIIYKIRGEAHVIQDEFRNTYQKNPVQ